MKTFRKEERLCSKKSLDLLFKNGSSFLLYPYRITFLKTEELKFSPAQLVVTVSKKRFKRAVDRNLLKRRIREAYRHSKQDFLYKPLEEIAFSIFLSIQYVGKEKYDYDFLMDKIRKALVKLVKRIHSDETH